MLRRSTTTGCAMLCFSRSRSSARNCTHSVTIDQRVGALHARHRRRRNIRYRAVPCAPAPCRPDRGAHLRAHVEQPRDQRDRRRLAHVVGVGLEGRPSTATVLPRRLPPAAFATLRAIARLRLSLTAEHRLDDAQLHVVILRDLDQRAGVLREARAAEARAGMQEFAADAVVEPDAARDFLHVGADFLGKIGDLVDEGDLGGEEGVRRVFDQLGGAPAVNMIGAWFSDSGR